MNMSIKADRPTIVVGCSLVVIALLVVYWILHFWLLRQDFADQIAAIQPRTARLLGMEKRFDQLEVANNEAGNLLRELAYPADKDSAMTAAALQQDIREVMAGAGFSISGSQILASRRTDGFDRLGLDITVVGNIDALDDALTELGMMRPLVFVEFVTIKPSRSRARRQPVAEKVPEGDPRKLTARFQLFSLRVVQ